MDYSKLGYSDLFGNDLCYHGWIYKGHKCIIRPEDDRFLYTVTTPEGEVLVADINPHLGSPDLVEMWIEAGYPSRISGAPLNREDLEKIGPMSKLAALVRFGRIKRISPNGNATCD